MKHLPKWIKYAAMLEFLGLVLLGFSLWASTPIAYLATIGLGSGCLVLGGLCFLLFFIGQMRNNTLNEEIK